MKHYDELELLESYYMPDAPEQREHLSGCDVCAQRFQRLTAALQQSARSVDVVVDAQPETFWKRQRAAITRDSRRAAEVSPWRRYAAAATLVALLSGGIAYRLGPEERADVQTLPVHPPAPSETYGPSSDDPWASEELSEFRAVVDWESWETTKAQGGTS